ncbi:alpha-1,4-glucan--maltose-1-phosphate maltosyltransferase [Stakelama sp. CBK3Z-3]|uniref:Alpha-1,4-glucan:maltose-1-phosphate maltosyltransferase n=1 Tax=Stakelama flava TaxID=2860338 RepID=A0ABS6XGH5_9SPHN|nr:alpha-1,4-glucan--maltose-1-phosphate maltosyltransferase [Stakelama flava]MBW4329277.1 alpha-1,4-glucan--maltose-1-phosphate maltosyltransferase [Stakelama flava]
MPSFPQRIVSAPSFAIDGERFEKVVEASGAQAILLGERISLFGDEARTLIDQLSGVAERVPAVMIDVDPTRFPLDHSLVQSHPELFAIRRTAGAGAIVDPRRAMPATGEALARLRVPDTADLLGEAIIERLDAFIAAGARGFRLSAAERVSVALIERLSSAMADRGVSLIAGPMADRQGGVRLAHAGLDALVSSYGWWDLSASWMVEEVEALREAAPLIAEFSSDHPRAEAALTLLPIAADGAIIPIEWTESDTRLRAVRGAFSAFDTVSPIRGALRQASAPGDAITVLVRAESSDPRQAGTSIVGLVCNAQSDQPIPAAAALLQSAGGFSGTFTGSDGGEASSTLRAGEACLLRAHATSAITPSAAARGDAMAARTWPRLVIDAVTPRVEGGDFVVKRVVGDLVTVEADVFADGHEQLAAELQWRGADESEWRRVRMDALGNDRWRATFVPDRLGAHVFRVVGWLDRFSGFTRDFRKKLIAGVAQPVDYSEGLALIGGAAERAPAALGKELQALVERIEQVDADSQAELLLDHETARLMDQADDRPHTHSSPEQRLDAERLAARFSSWYELFPRSMTDDKARHGTFVDVLDRLPAIRDMGFDTLYFPPIHPIGKTNRKGPNNTLTPGPDDPGSPYAIGSEYGGHDAIHPELGSFEDFDRLIAVAHEHGLEIALDFAIQCAPDHPWLKEHPGWFAWRPDGSMKYAENPPKKYQDIVNVDFYGPDAVPALWIALRDVVLLWVDHGVKTFRVDNPHTKPLPFWEWMIAEVRAEHPDVIFLAEAFTRPTMMYRLAKVGFSQSYTYFTWRDTKHDLIEYITELTTTAPKEFYRPHFFVNTPDINPSFLQNSGRAGFRIRAVLAATLSGLFGVYSGFELCESAPLAPGKEEYLDSEKYEIRPRDYEAPGNIIADITTLNRLRRAYPALQTHLNTQFHPAYDDNIIWYAKPAADGGSMIMVMVNLDPHHVHECDFEVPLWKFGLSDDAGVAVEDLAEGHRFTWHGKTQHIRIAPDEPYRIWRIAPEMTA